jgi:hypothetical protein
MGRRGDHPAQEVSAISNRPLRFRELSPEVPDLDHIAVYLRVFVGQNRYLTYWQDAYKHLQIDVLEASVPEVFTPTTARW